jgi:hypothetical protein
MRIEIVIDFANQSNMSKSMTPPQQFNLQVPDKIVLQHVQHQESKQAQLSGLSSVNNNRKVIIVENFNKKLTKMSILISSMSILSHLGMTFLYISFGSTTTINSIWTHSATLIIILLIQLKYISNFFLFFFYNKNFRIIIYKIFISMVMCIPGIKF